MKKLLTYAQNKARIDCGHMPIIELGKRKNKYA